MMMPTGWMHHPGAKHHHHRREGGKEGLRQFDSRLGQNQEELSSLGSYKVCLFISLFISVGAAPVLLTPEGGCLACDLWQPVAPVAAGKKEEWEAAAREEEEDDDDGAGSVWPPVWLGHHATHAMAGGGPGGPPCGGGAAASLHSFFFEYDTPRIVLIKSRKVGLMNRLVQLAILAYVVGWVFVWQKGYQEKDSVVSSVTTKVKGVALTNTSKLGLRIWDVADYVIPPQGENSVFIMTNLIVTLNQTQGRCPEVPESDHSTSCQSDKDCKEGYAGTHSNGVQTGKCIPYNVTVKTCEVFAWCPVENDDNVPKPAFLKAAENFTLLVKNNIWYPKFNFTKRNILPTISKTYLKNCTYNAKTDPFCPIFRIGDVVEAAGQNFQEMAVEGGVMGLQIDWNCDLDKPASRCVPTYTFRRIDNKDSAHTVSPGYNFRFAKYYKTADGTDSRTLIKAYGIRFDIMVFGKAGKFDIIPTMINIGSGLALFGVATVLCDIIVLYFMKKRYYYREKKYKYVEDYELGANLSYGSQSESQEINGNQ